MADCRSVCLLGVWCQRLRAFLPTTNRKQVGFSGEDNFLKVAVRSPIAEGIDAIKQLLSPWQVTFTGLDDAELVVAYGERPIEAKKTLMIHSDVAGFTQWIRDAKLRVSRTNEESVCAVIDDQTVLTIKPQALFHYDSASGTNPKNVCLSEIMLEDDLSILSFDIISEYRRIMDETLNAQESRTYRLLTGLPIPYSLAPHRVRDMLMKGDAKSEKLTFRDRLALDALRFILVGTIEKLTKKRLTKKAWNAKPFACALTHDVETQKGLQTAKRLKKLEEKYDIPSAWYVPSEHYKLDNETLKQLANHGEIGTHDTKHDGKLIRLTTQKTLQRLRAAKETLEQSIGEEIRGFRAPLLQHNYGILQAITSAGYLYDTSIPTWEPKHPYTMKPHGIGTVFPLDINGVAEIPVTLPQDHQMLHSLGMTADQTLNAWTGLMREIERIGGLCVFLVHPDYDLAEATNKGTYESLLNAIANSHASITLPRALAKSVPDESALAKEVYASSKQA